ncbi:MAG: peptidoglycan-binding protein [Actinomycetota bacterium]
MERAGSTPNKPHEDKPLLFISHRHEDKTIADILRSFIISRTANRVEVFQSSSAMAEGPRVGGLLNRQLMDFLWHTDVLILLYTNPNRDWSYCMWEYGVMLDDRKPDAKPILFQFADRYPPLFSDQVRVDVRKRHDVEKFTKDLLTDRDFFPNYPGPVTGFFRESEDVKRASDELYESLLAVAPEDNEDPEPWPPYPYLQLSIDLDHINRICQAAMKERVQLAREVVENEAVLTTGNAEAGRLFGKRTRVENIAFKELLARWREKFPDWQARWVDAICSQIIAAAMDEFPTSAWELMRATDLADGTWYGPALVKVQKSSRQHCMKFDVCFLKFVLDDDDRIIARVPRERRILDLRNTEQQPVTGKHVRDLQVLLNRFLTAGDEGKDGEPIPPLLADGIGGAKTKQATLAFQSAKSLVQDAIVGPLTWRKLIEPEGQKSSVSRI